jgi:hypothetical protein
VLVRFTRRNGSIRCGTVCSRIAHSVRIGQAQIFYALALAAAEEPTDKTYAARLKAGAILERLFREEPNHPGLGHYIIHTYDVPSLAGKALGAEKPTVESSKYYLSIRTIAVGVRIKAHEYHSLSFAAGSLSVCGDRLAFRRDAAWPCSCFRFPNPLLVLSSYFECSRALRSKGMQPTSIPSTLRFRPSAASD